jgi:hypothetical protein
MANIHVGPKIARATCWVVETFVVAVDQSQPIHATPRHGTAEQ